MTQQQKNKQPNKKWAEDTSRHFSKKKTQMINKQWRKCSVSLTIRKMQIKTKMRYHLTSIRMITIKQTGKI